jgi:hypothetical protein
MQRPGSRVRARRLVSAAPTPGVDAQTSIVENSVLKKGLSKNEARRYASFSRAAASYPLDLGSFAQYREMVRWGPNPRGAIYVPIDPDPFKY